MLRFLFPIPLFISAILLFSIQPMVARALLPIYGGTPAVWTVCMLFFQAVLLIAYGYVWLLSLINKANVWRYIHLLFVALSLVSLPILFHPQAMNGLPEFTILATLLRELGLPLLVIGASAPLLQFAYSQTTGKRAADPYFLYAASNLGSLLTLVSYPWIIERFIGLNLQFDLWNIGYFSYLGLLGLVLFAVRYQPLEKTAKGKDSLPWRDMMRWVFLSFIPCSLMLGVTLYISTDVAATPLFWVLPLALYLLTFIFTFTTKPLISHAWVVRNCLFFLLFTVIGFILGVHQILAWQLIMFNLLSFFVLAMLCHGELFSLRPKPQLLTLFYFCLSIGGVLAGIFNGLLAPHWFNTVYEYPIAIILGLVVLPNTVTAKKLWMPLLIVGLLLLGRFLPETHLPFGINTYQALMLLALSILMITRMDKKSFVLSMSLVFLFVFCPFLNTDDILYQGRSFYGVKQVLEKKDVHVLISQSTVHGLQLVGEAHPNGYRAYYGALQSVVTLLQQQYNSMNITVVGLGAGTMVCQHRASDNVKLIEIDQQVIDIANNTKLFTYLHNCPAHTESIKNDGRIAVKQFADKSQNLLLLDAFTSDAIPVHLMTLEAFTLYQKKLKQDGVILVNLSNRHMQLLPVLNAIGRKLDMMVFSLAHRGDPKLGQFASEWALLTSNENLAPGLMKTGWKFAANGKQILWTDDYSNIIPLLKW